MSSSSSSSPRDTASYIYHLSVLFFCGIINITGIRKKHTSSKSGSSPPSFLPPSPLQVVVMTCDVVFAVIVQIYILPFPSIVPWWGPLTSVVSQSWYRIFLDVHGENDNDSTSSSTSSTIGNYWSSWIKRQIVHGGPLGKGLGKLVEVLVAIVLWKVVHGSWPSIQWGPMPSISSWSILLAVVVIVNLVLYTWSYYTQSRGRHVGVKNMVSTTTNRTLTITEHLQFLLLAVVNATCEEITSRWFWWNEFKTYDDDDSIYRPNLYQALLFGIWHYDGIPSGWIGVGLAFFYGTIMGIMKEYLNDGGLFLPVCGHAVADYYLFASIARGRAVGSTATARSKPLRLLPSRCLSS